MRMRTQIELERVQKSTGQLLREQREEQEAANAPASEPIAPVQGERPHKAAQWDERQGAWVVWDKFTGAWVPYGS